MPLILVFVVGIAVALLRRRLVAAPDDPIRSQDVPARLLGWAVGLLAAQRDPWGQAMIGELDRLDGRARRWRFALGCVGAAVVMPPWGRATTAFGVLLAIAASAGGLAAYAHVHYRLGTDGWTWVAAALVLLVLTGHVLGGGVLLRRRGVVGPGLVGGLLVAATWLIVSGGTVRRTVTGLWSHPWLLFVAPVLVGVGGTLWSRGDAATGRRAARLAASTAALAVYLYGVLAVTVIGAGGGVRDDGWTDAQLISDRLGEQATFYLVALPLMASTIGWAAAAATARLRRGRTAGPVLPAPAQVAKRAPGGPAEPPDLRPAPKATRRTGPRQRRTWYRLVLCAALAAAALLVAVAEFRG